MRAWFPNFIPCLAHVAASWVRQIGDNSLSNLDETISQLLPAFEAPK
jgi:hypothetical protein